ncbi:MAG TPA: response regulator transcription factor [Conexibacter sp.]|nr:response regulator transcription factor [Conexibacter sp.]
MTEHAGRRTVLVVDDEPTIAEIVSRYLVRAGYDAPTAGDGFEAMRLVDERRPDLVVLDVMLPRLDGLEVLRRLREQDGPSTPVILLTARGEHSDKIAGLRNGADDYMVKPFSPHELVARVEAVMRRTHPPDAKLAEPMCFGQLEIDPRARRVAHAGTEVKLTQREFDLLVFLAEHPGQAFPREEIMDRVWDGASLADPSTVTVHIRRLRTKLEPDPEHPRWIETVWGFGYRFQP